MDFVTQLGVRGLNHLIAAESWAQERLRRHTGAQVLLVGGPFSVRLGLDHAGLFQLVSASGEPDVRLTLPADIVSRVLLSPDSLFSSIKLEGSIDVAESLAFVFRHLKWDVESDLADLVGDIPAHRLVRIGRSLARAMQDGVFRLAGNIREYTVEESAILPSQGEVATFGYAVHGLRDDVARLEKRLSLL